MDDEMEPEAVRLAANDCGDLCGLVPYLTGYRPQERIVMVVLDQNRLRVTAAASLDGWDRSEAAGLVEVTRRWPGALVFLSAWSEDVERAEAALGLAELELPPERVLDSIVVGPELWWSRLHPDCHGASSDLGAGPAAAAAVVAGLTTAGSREEVVALLPGPVPEGDEAAARAFLAAAERLAAMDDRAWSRRAEELHRRGRSQSLSPGEMAELAVLVDDALVLQERWVGSSRRTCERDLALWRSVLAGCPQDWSVGVLMAVAHAAWLAGQGTLVVAALDRAWPLASHWPPCRLMDVVCRDALPPEAWDRIRLGAVGGGPIAAA